jgi:HPt (histidine-containing phosphotransfer) domain-containing protein
MNVDWERINSLLSDVNDPEEIEWLKEMVINLITDFEKNLSELSTYTPDTENQKITSMLHLMKGVTANFGLENVLKVIKEAESLSKEKKSREALELAKSLDSIWVDTKSELKSKLSI